MASAQKKAERDLDETLDLYRSAHAAVARYTLKIIDGNTKAETILKTNVPLEAAMKEAHDYNKNAGDSFRRNICIPILENSEEARAAVRAAAEAYWLQ